MNQNISDLSYVIIFFYKFLTDWRKIGVKLFLSDEFPVKIVHFFGHFCISFFEYMCISIPCC